MKNHLSEDLLESLNVLDLLQEEGLKIVPAYPTSAMLKAGAQITGLSEETVKKLYLSMLSFSDEEIPEQKN